MDNLSIYEKVRNVPETALKTIQGGKLKGMSDINPMWRIKKLTEIYGPCGFGWYTEELLTSVSELPNGEITILVDIALYVKDGGEWSKPIYGTGGSMLLQFEKGKLVANDEGKKMAYTDAVSIACKALGFAADVYFAKDRTKYTTQSDNDSQTPRQKNTTPSPATQPVDMEKQALVDNINAQIKKLTAITGLQSEFIKKTAQTNTKCEGKTTEELRKINHYIAEWVKAAEQEKNQ